mmetsp:Transcript_78516/g.230289  ORF Transcript_78516/g.230289 Transcript_78516/m.230289 type:complete len:267 (+) Transcript_78516:233-1033(+)
MRSPSALPPPTEEEPLLLRRPGVSIIGSLPMPWQFIGSTVSGSHGFSMPCELCWLPQLTAAGAEVTAAAHPTMPSSPGGGSGGVPRALLTGEPMLLPVSATLQGLQSSAPSSLRSSPAPPSGQSEPVEERCLRRRPRRPRACPRAGVATPATARPVGVGGLYGHVPSNPDMSMRYRLIEGSMAARDAQLRNPSGPPSHGDSACSTAAGVARFTSTHLPARWCEAKSIMTASAAAPPCGPPAKRTKPKPRDLLVRRSTMTTASATGP